jgi:hypothetical protein
MNWCVLCRLPLTLIGIAMFVVVYVKIVSVYTVKTPWYSVSRLLPQRVRWSSVSSTFNDALEHAERSSWKLWRLIKSRL